MSILSGLIAQQIAQREGLTDTNKYLLLGWMLNGPLGLGVTLALANQEADSLPQTVPAVSGLSITTPSQLPAGKENQMYAQTLQASGGKGNLTWAIGPGTSLPKGLSLDSGSGALSGTPAAGVAATYTLSIQVTDSSATPVTVSRGFSLTISPAQGSQVTPAAQQLSAGGTSAAAVTGKSP